MRIHTALLSFISVVVADQLSADQLASKYALTTSTSLPFPAETGSGQPVIVADWSLNKGRIQNGPNDLAFVSDPFPKDPAPGLQTSDNGTSPVLEVTYPAGSFSHDTGGAQFYSMWNNTGPAFQTMMVSYEVAFDEKFNWVKGGKLPGLRGGPASTGCSGGNEPNGTDCFSTRLMWRPDGRGEVYAYIPTPNGICNKPSITCNDDFGVSISRGSFTFASGQWNRVTLLVMLNSPGDIVNGHLELYFNDQKVISQDDLYFRSSLKLSANGLFFSTFFGGNDDSWATPELTHTYFRNIRLWAGSNPSNLPGAKVSGGESSKINMWRISSALGFSLVIGWALL